MIRVVDGIVYFYGNEAGVIKEGKALVNSKYQCGELYDKLRDAGYTVEWV